MEKKRGRMRNAKQKHTYMQTQGLIELALQIIRRRNNLIYGTFIHVDKIKLNLYHTSYTIIYMAMSLNIKGKTWHFGRN